MPFFGLLTAGLGLAGGIIGSRSANRAAEAQDQSTRYAADLSRLSSQEALALQQRIFEQQQQNQQPWLEAGQGALLQLRDLLAPGGGLRQQFKFDARDFQGDPGFQFRMGEGEKAIQRSAAARGGALGGATLKALARFGQDYASNEYDRAFSRAFNTFQTDQGNTFNRLSSLAGTGQQAVNQLNSDAGQYGANAGQNILGTGNTLANLATQGGNARASGYIGAGNAWQNALGTIGQGAQGAYLMHMLKR
jgi:hypothetical protein